eukprot:Hpha_TRINITY_DN16450_c2_g1::TRINITY_DN16450_c2_g1_i7::g.163886::m.163886
MVNHGVTQENFERISSRAHEFFDLDDSEKIKYSPQRWQADSRTQYRGYFPKSANGKEGLDIGNILPEAKAMYDSGRFERHSALDEETVLPPRETMPEGWYGDVEAYYRTMLRISRMVLRAVSMHWGLDPQELPSKLLPEEGCPPLATLRFNMYPSSTMEEALRTYKLRADENSSQPLSCDTHTDGAVITLLYQSDVGGLQAQMKSEDGEAKWVDVPVVPNAIVVNTGVGMQRIVNDLWNATNHRVLWSGRRRLSIPFFVELGFETPFGPIAPAVAASPVKIAKYPEMEYGAYITHDMRRHKEYQRKMKSRDWTGIAVKFIHDLRFEDIPEAALDGLKSVLLDSFGSAAGAQVLAFSRVARNAASALHPGSGASLWFAESNNSSASLEGAALANAVGQERGIVSSALALAEGGEKLVDGRELLALLAVGYEVALRAEEALGKPHASAMGIAAMAARHLGLSRNATLNALGIVEHNLPMSNGLSPSPSSDTAVWSALQGMTAATHAQMGFTQALGSTVKRIDLMSTLGRDWQIIRRYVHHRHGVCNWAQAAVHGAITVREKLWPALKAVSASGGRSFFALPLPPGDAADVAAIEVRAPAAVVELFKQQVENTDEAQCNVGYASAASLLWGAVGPGELKEDALKQAQALMEKTSAVPHGEAWTEVTVRLHDGRSATSGHKHAEWDRGAGEAPPSGAELKERFRWMVKSGGLTEDFASAMENTINRAESLENAEVLSGVIGRLSTSSPSCRP